MPCVMAANKVSRGGANTKTYSTSNLISHLKAKHSELYRKFDSQKVQGMEEPTATSTLTKAKQLTLFESGEQVVCVGHQ